MVEETDITKTGVDAPSAESAPPQPHATIEPSGAGGTSSQDISSDIAHILEESKLPERTPFRAQGDRPTTPSVERPRVEEKIPTPPPPVTPKTDENHISAIRTLREDVQEAIHDEHVSLTSMLSMESQRKRLKQTQIDSSPGDTQRKRRTAGVLFATLILFILGAGAIFGVVVILQQQGSAANTTAATQGIVFAEQSVGLSLDNTTPATIKGDLGQALAQQNGALGSILQIVPIRTGTSSNGASAVQPATLSEFLTALGIQPPPDLLRALGDTFFFGIHTTSKGSAVFIIPVTSYDRAFAGMLAWEATMDQDFSSIFPQVSPYVIGSNGLPTTRGFKDLVMQNYDARVLEDDSGKIVLYYTFPTQNYLIIAENPATLTEVLSRMQARREI